MTMKRTSGILFALALFVVALAAAAIAQVKVGVIDSQEVLEKSAEGKKVLARLTETDKQNQAAIAKLDDEIRQLQTKLNTQRLTLTEDAVTQLRTDLERKNTDRKRKAEDAYASMQELTQRLFTKVQDELIPIVEQLGKETGPRRHPRPGQERGAVYWSPAIDLTADVIKRYDAAKAHRQVTAGAVLNIEDILRFLPHRYPFLLVDRVLAIEPGKLDRRAQERHLQRGVLPGPFPGDQDHAGRPDRRGHGPGRGDPALPFHPRSREEVRPLQQDREHEVPPAGRARRPAPAGVRAAQVQGQVLLAARARRSSTARSPSKAR